MKEEKEGKAPRAAAPDPKPASGMMRLCAAFAVSVMGAVIGAVNLQEARMGGPFSVPQQGQGVNTHKKEVAVAAAGALLSLFGTPKKSRVPLLLLSCALYLILVLIVEKKFRQGPAWVETMLLLGAQGLSAVSGVMPLKLWCMNSILITAIYQTYGASLLDTASGVVGVSTMSCLLYFLLDFSAFKRTVSESMELPEHSLGPSSSAGHSKQVWMQQQQQQQQQQEQVQQRKQVLQENLQQQDVLGVHAQGDVRAAAFDSVQNFKDLALQTMVARGFGTNLPPAVLYGTAARPKKYTPNQVVQVSFKIRSVIKPSMLPIGAMPGLVGLMKSRHPTLQVRGPAVREGCIIVTLDVMQLAGVLSGMEKQQQQQQQWQQGQGLGDMDDIHSQRTSPGSVASTGEDRFKLLQEHVAAAGQQWLSAMGMDSLLEEDTVMSVQVLDTVHHFNWSSEARTWRPCGSELVPFGSQHSIAAHSLTALQTSTCQAKQADPPLSPRSHPCGSSFPALVELALDVYTLPGEVLMGWEGLEQEQYNDAKHGGRAGGAGVVHVLARLEGAHVPVTILECKQHEPERGGCGDASYARQKQVVRIQVPCQERPCFVQLELWQQHVMLAPACGVLLLPASLAEVATELQARAAESRAECKGVIQSSPSWDCAAAATDDCGSQQRSGFSRMEQEAAGDEGSVADDGLDTFVADCGFWLEEMAHMGSHDCGGTLSQLRFAPSSTYDSLSVPSGENCSADMQDKLCGSSLQWGPPEAEERTNEDTINLGIGLLQQAVSWGMPALAEVVLLGLLAEPCNMSFDILANGSPHTPATDQDLGPDANFECFKLHQPGIQLDDEEDQMVSLLNLALLSRNRDMLARVLAWGHSLGGPNFAWSWRAQDAHGITPLLRIQALSRTHRELLELALADLHAGPSLLASWLQEGPRGLQLSSHHPTPSAHGCASTAAGNRGSFCVGQMTKNGFDNSSRLAGTPQASASSSSITPAAAAAFDSIEPAPSSSISTAPLATHAPLPNDVHQRAAGSDAPLCSATGQHAIMPNTMQQRLQLFLQYWAWLLPCGLWGFPEGGLRLPECVLEAHGIVTAPTPSHNYQQQQQQQQAKAEGAMGSSSSSSCVAGSSSGLVQRGLTAAPGPSRVTPAAPPATLLQGVLLVHEDHYQDWMLVKEVAPMTAKLSLMSSVMQLMWICMSPWLYYSNGGGTRHFISTMPLYGGMTVFTFITCMLSSGVGATVKPNVLRAWTVFFFYARGTLWALVGLGTLPNTAARCQFGLCMYLDFMLEFLQGISEMLPLHRVLMGRCFLGVCFYAFYTKHPVVQSPQVRACVVHSFGMLVSLGQHLRLRHRYLAAYLAARLKQQ